PLPLGAIHTVEAGHDVGLTSPLSLAPVDALVQGAYRVMGPASRPEALGALQEGLLVDGLPDLAAGVLDHLVLARRHPHRPRLPWPLGDRDPSERVRAGARRFHRGVEPLEMRCQLWPVWLLRAPRHAYRCVGPWPAIGAGERGA